MLRMTVRYLPLLLDTGPAAAGCRRLGSSTGGHRAAATATGEAASSIVLAQTRKLKERRVSHFWWDRPGVLGCLVAGHASEGRQYAEIAMQSNAGEEMMMMMRYAMLQTPTSCKQPAVRF